MRKNHESRLKGRFIKNTHPNAQRVTIEKFNLVEICTSDITYTDNQDSTIIHQRLHDKEELESKIKTPKRIDEKFKIDNLRPVIKPLDFTSDWSKQRTYLSRNKTSLEEDDEENPEFINLAREIREESQLSFTSDVAEEPSETRHSPLIISSDKENGKSTSSDSSEDGIGDDHDKAQNEEKTHDETLTSQIDQENEMEQHSFQASEVANDSAADIAEDTYNPPEKEFNATPEPKKTNPDDDFIPMSADNINASARSQEDIDEAYENAKAAGYQDGFMQGEEKGTIQSKENLRTLSAGLQDMVKELESLKANVLHNAQENFQIICQTMIESILNHHFKANPDALSTVIKKAMDESVENDSFTIFVSKQVINQVKESIDESLKDKIKASDELDGFNFKIESNLTVIDGNINQIVTDLLEQADLNLFTEEERAG